jgi:hypothetical protein
MEASPSLWGRTLLLHDLCLVVIVAEQSPLNLLNGRANLLFVI